MHEFANEISRHVWQTKYKFVDRSVSERSITDTWCRVARVLAARFFAIQKIFGFLPGGRIQAGIASDVTLFNCFVMV
ncbi:MAG: hypothetical protein ACM3IH_08530 [Sphingobacteriales bacterium]|jgi:hypothetical protein